MSEEIKPDIDAEFVVVPEESPIPEPTPEELAAAQAAAEAEAALQAKANAVASQDLALLIDEYLSDKAELRDENDSFNIANGSIFRWDFKNIPQPSIEQLYELILDSDFSAPLEIQKCIAMLKLHGLNKEKP